jgi:hypothetical protein
LSDNAQAAGAWRTELTKYFGVESVAIENHPNGGDATTTRSSWSLQRKKASPSQNHRVADSSGLLRATQTKSGSAIDSV